MRDGFYFEEDTLEELRIDEVVEGVNRELDLMKSFPVCQAVQRSSSSRVEMMKKNQRAKSTAGTKEKKSMANSSQRRIKRAYTQQQGKSRTYHNSREIKEHRQPQAETVTQRKKSNS